MWLTGRKNAEDNKSRRGLVPPSLPITSFRVSLFNKDRRGLHWAVMGSQMQTGISLYLVIFVQFNKAWAEDLSFDAHTLLSFLRPRQYKMGSQFWLLFYKFYDQAVQEQLRALPPPYIRHVRLILQASFFIDTNDFGLNFITLWQKLFMYNSLSPSWANCLPALFHPNFIWSWKKALSNN